MKIDKKHIWDYDVRTIDLSNPSILRWYLTRKIEAGEWESIDSQILKKNLDLLEINPTLKMMIRNYYAHQTAKNRS